MSRHSTEDRSHHILHCSACWLQWAEMQIRIDHQRQERDWYREWGLPAPFRNVTYEREALPGRWPYVPIAGPYARG